METINIEDFKKFINNTFISDDLDIEEQLQTYTSQMLDLYVMNLELKEMQK